MQHTKTIMLCAMMLCGEMVSAQSMQSLLKLPEEILKSEWETTDSSYDLVYTNNDYCDYYMYQIGDRSYTLSPGKNVVFSIQKESQAANPFHGVSGYYRYRGKFPEKFQTTTLYALPVKNGQEVSWQVDRRERMRTMQFDMQQGDTVYATRGGTVCKTAYERQLLIYQPDQTFAAYLVMDKLLVYPGEAVEVGQPVGIAGPTGVSITYFFLDKNKFNGEKAVGYAYSHFLPLFRTAQGDLKPQEGTAYRALVDDKVIMQDMTKREQKKYLKNKNKK